MSAPGEDDLDPDVLEELEAWSGPEDDEEGADGVLPAGGALVLVGTPIGNLGDLSPRAVQALTDADVVYCEDTRHSRKLLTHSGIVAPRSGPSTSTTRTTVSTRWWRRWPAAPRWCW